MKRTCIIYILLCALLWTFGSATTYAGTGNLIKDQVVVTIADGKYLSELIDEDVAPNITNLKIVGAIDGTDISYLRDLLGVGRKNSVDKDDIKSKLQILDLSEAYICEGGTSYCDYTVRMTTYHACTADNVVGMYMFASCHSLKKVTLPCNTTSIGDYAFQDCSELEEIIKYDKIARIGAYAFSNCSKLKEFEIPELEKLNEYTFSGCKSFISLEIPEGITDLPKSFASNCSSLKNIVLPKSLASVGWGALSGCSSLERIDLPETLETIMLNAFSNCTSLRYFRLPAGIKNVYNDIISGCKALEEIHLPKLPLSMGYAFRNCQAKHVYAYEQEPMKLNQFTFQNFNYSTCTLHVPKGSCDAYATAYYWRDFGTIVEMNEGEGDDETPKTAFVVFDPSNGVLTFKYEANKPDGAYSMNAAGRVFPLWQTYHANEIQSVVFDDSFAKALPTNCFGWFYECKNLKKIEGIEKLNTTKVTDMGAMFRNCSALTTLDVSNFDTQNVTNMGYMFAGCSNLSTVYVSENFVTKDVTEDTNMFMSCSSLTGAVSYNKKQNGKDMANYRNGYFKTYYKIGNEMYPLYGETLSVNDLALTDGDDLELRCSFNTNTASYSSKLDDGTTWETLCLPFDVSLTSKNFRAFAILSVKADVVELQEIEDYIARGTPVIIKMAEGATTIDITENDRTIAKDIQNDMLKDNCKLVGIYSRKTFGNGNNCFVTNGNKLVKVKNMPARTRSANFTLNGFHAYMQDCSNAGITADEYGLDVKEATAIGLLENTAEGTSEYYDLEGRRLNDLKKGVNIVKRGGKTTKVVIR